MHRRLQGSSYAPLVFHEVRSTAARQEPPAATAVTRAVWGLRETSATEGKP